MKIFRATLLVFVLTIMMIIFVVILAPVEFIGNIRYKRKWFRLPSTREFFEYHSEKNDSETFPMKKFRNKTHFKTIWHWYAYYLKNKA